MTKRKLDTKRLYDLVKTIVIVITSFYLLLALYNSYYEINSPYSLKECFNQCDETWPKDYESTRDIWQSCNKNCLTLSVEQGKDTKISWMIALGLPALFFGGTWLFNYLFPKKKK